MYLVVGLGNIGKEYNHTRHNVGFDVIDVLSKEYNVPINREKFKGEYGEGHIGSNKVILLKPSTYMNLSGESIIQFVNFYKIPNDRVIVIYDDVSLEVGKLRVREKGSAGGHNGIKSIISRLSSDVFPRVKVGVGGPEKDLISHVLGRFNPEEAKIMEKVFEVCAEAVSYIIKNDLREAMNKFNGVKVQ